MRSKSRASRLQSTSRTTRSRSRGEGILRFGDEVGFELVLVLILNSNTNYAQLARLKGSPVRSNIGCSCPTLGGGRGPCLIPGLLDALRSTLAPRSTRSAEGTWTADSQVTVRV